MAVSSQQSILRTYILLYINVYYFQPSNNKPQVWLPQIASGKEMVRSSLQVRILCCKSSLKNHKIDVKTEAMTPQTDKKGSVRRTLSASSTSTWQNSFQILAPGLRCKPVFGTTCSCVVYISEKSHITRFIKFVPSKDNHKVQQVSPSKTLSKWLENTKPMCFPQTTSRVCNSNIPKISTSRLRKIPVHSNRFLKSQP